jgi:hypothetical protein
MRAGAGFDFYQAGIGRRLKIEAGGRPFATMPKLLLLGLSGRTKKSPQR